MQTPTDAPSQPTFAPPAERAPGPLDRSISLNGISLYAVAWVVVFGIGAALRLMQLDRFALAPGEAMRAFDGWNLYTGTPLDPGTELPVTQPLLVLGQALSFFLFGASDVAARFVPAAAGLALIGLLALLRPVVGRAGVIGMAFLVAISPTMVYTSRVVDSNILLAVAAVVIVAAVSRLGLAAVRGEPTRRWAASAGVGVGLLLAAGPASVSVLLGLGVGLAVSVLLDPDRAERFGPDGEPLPKGPSTNVLVIGLRAILRDPSHAISLAVAFAVTVVALFTRLFSDPGAISGVWTLFADWGRLVGGGAPAIPTQFFLLVVLLYELLALVFAVVCVVMPAHRPVGNDPVDVRASAHLSWPFFLGWFGFTLVFFAFSSGRESLDAAQVVLPLTLVAGLGVGRLLETIDWRGATQSGGILIALAAVGIFVGLVAAFALTGDARDDGMSAGAALLQVTVVLVIVIGGMVMLALAAIQRLRQGGYPVQVGRMVLLAVLVLLGGVTVRSTTELSFWNVASGNELLAQETPTEAIPALVNRLSVLSRDVSVQRSNVADPLGQHSLRVVVDPAVEWPFRWYMREYTSLTLGTPETAASSDAEVVLAAEGASLPAGYTPQTYTYLNRVPAAYSQPSFGEVLRHVFVPGEWEQGKDYLFFRRLAEPALPSSLVVGYGPDLSTRLFQTSVPVNLFDGGAYGTGEGQLWEPRGVALSNDGERIYVMDSINARVQVFDVDGNFVEAWGGANSASDLELGIFSPSESATFGASDLIVGPNDLVYIADTWNHVIRIVSPEGDVVRDIGVPGGAVDIGDAPADVAAEPGRFFGPRAVAVTDTEIYVTDTGNERIQVFALDGTFLRAFGGFGSGPGQLIEPVGVAVDASGQVYVADSGNARISVFSADGAPVAQWPVPAWEPYVYDPATQVRPNFEPYVLAAPDGRVYVTSRVSSSVLVYQPDGTQVTELTAVGGVDLLSPVGITVSSEGDLYVSDIDLNTVLRQPLSDLVPAGDGTAATPEAALPSDLATPTAADGVVVDQLPVGATPPAPPIA